MIIMNEMYYFGENTYLVQEIMDFINSNGLLQNVNLLEMHHDMLTNFKEAEYFANDKSVSYTHLTLPTKA